MPRSDFRYPTNRYRLRTVVLLPMLPTWWLVERLTETQPYGMLCLRGRHAYPLDRARESGYGTASRRGSQLGYLSMRLALRPVMRM